MLLVRLDLDQRVKVRFALLSDADLVVEVVEVATLAFVDVGVVLVAFLLADLLRVLQSVSTQRVYNGGFQEFTAKNTGIIVIRHNGRLYRYCL